MKSFKYNFVLEASQMVIRMFCFDIKTETWFLDQFLSNYNKKKFFFWLRVFLSYIYFVFDVKNHD